MIRNHIESIVKQLVDAPHFEYGTVNELNLLSDKDMWANGVVFLYTLKPINLEYTVSNTIESRYSIYMEFLYLTQFDQYTSQNEDIITKAYWMMKEFLIKLSYYRENQDDARFFRVHVADKSTSLPVYNKFDTNSTGVNLSITLEKMTPHSFDPSTRPPGYIKPPNPDAPIVLPPPIYT